MGNRPRTASIHVLDDDSLLHVFYLCRPFLEDENNVADWRHNGRWWYVHVHVCRRWRNIVLSSANYLGLSLLCTYGTPVADMLAHSPPLPLVVGYFRKDCELTTEDKEGIILALKQHDRVRRVRINSLVTNIEKLFVVMDEEYPILEHLHISPRTEDTSSILTIPETLQAPRLRQLTLRSFALPIRSRLLTTAVGLVTLHLVMVHPSTYFHPNTLLQWILLMPQLEMLDIFFKFSIPNHDVERQLTHTPIIAAPIMLPNLHHFHFRGVSTYLEALAHRITAPHLEKLNIDFFNQLTFAIPRLLQFMDTSDNLRFGSANFTFSAKKVGMGVYPPGETNLHALSLVVKCCHLDWQVSSLAQISNSLSQIFSAVEHLTLYHKARSDSSEEHNYVDRIDWRKLLRPFSNVKTLRIRNGLATGNDLSRCLESEDGELPLALLPELQELIYIGSGNTRDTITSFIDARRNAGRPVTLVRQ